MSRACARRRTYGVVRLAALGTALFALAGCGSSSSSGSNTTELNKLITASLDAHPGFAVRSVHCPAQVKKAKGVVVRCSATLRDGEVDHVRATQTDNNETFDIVGSLIFADNVERAVRDNLPGTSGGAHVACPNRVPVVIGHTFTCRVTRAGSYSRALITIVDDDGGFHMSFS
jgi:hypothetical protein